MGQQTVGDWIAYYEPRRRSFLESAAVGRERRQNLHHEALRAGRFRVRKPDLLRAGLAAEPDELIEHCKTLLAKFKAPRAVFIEADLPRTPIGKIAKPVLRERISSPTARTRSTRPG